MTRGSRNSRRRIPKMLRPALARPLVLALVGGGRLRAPTMLRNVDRCELLLVTPSAVGQISAEDGRCELLAQAYADGTLVVLDDGSGAALPRPLTARALSALRNSLSLAPDGFGGSDGFGRAPTQSARPWRRTAL